MTDSRCSTDLAGLRQLAEELREYTAMKYAGDCKCGNCQLVPRPLVERLYHTLNSYGGAAQRAVDSGDLRTDGRTPSLPSTPRETP